MLNEYEIGLLVGFGASYLPAFGLYHWLVFRVNQKLPPDEEPIRHSLYLGGWSVLANEYKRLYPGSVLYQAVLILAVICFACAALFAGVRVWEWLAQT